MKNERTAPADSDVCKRLRDYITKSGAIAVFGLALPDFYWKTKRARVKIVRTVLVA